MYVYSWRERKQQFGHIAKMCVLAYKNSILFLNMQYNRKKLLLYVCFIAKKRYKNGACINNKFKLPLCAVCEMKFENAFFAA